MARIRSFWGWGYEDKFPDDDARRALSTRMGAVFGKAPELRPLPSLDAVRLPEPKRLTSLRSSAFANEKESRSCPTAEVRASSAASNAGQEVGIEGPHAST